MPIDKPIRIGLLRILRIAGVAATAGALYGGIVDPGSASVSIVRGALAGALIGGTISALDFFILDDKESRFAQASFGLNILARSLIYGVVFLFGIITSQVLTPTGEAIAISRDDILFCFAATFVISFLFEVNRLLGQNVLLAFATGRYHRPRVEQRIFLLIDMRNSTAAAERLGEVGFHRLLNRFVNDLTAPLVMFDGEIHKYVGDELIVTWPLAAGLKDSRCVRACFAAIQCLDEASPLYQRDFGAPIEIRAGLHCGPIVVGEMGSVKKEIALIGDALNTTARIVDACRSTGRPVLISGTLLERLSLPRGITASPLGPLQLRGKTEAMALFSLGLTGAS